MKKVNEKNIHSIEKYHYGYDCTTYTYPSEKSFNCIVIKNATIFHKEDDF